MTKHKLFHNILILLICLNTHFTLGQTIMSAQQKSGFLKDLVTSFEEEFLWDKKGKDIAKSLNLMIKDGNYRNIAKADIFVETLNRDLYKLSNDLHLKVGLVNTNPIVLPNTSTSSNKPFIQREVLDSGIYYLKFDTFPKLNKPVKRDIEGIMSSFTEPKKVIIDLRDNSGGSDETVNYMIGYFFDKNIKLATSYQWNTSPKEIWAKPKPQSENLSQTELIILTSRSTFSAAEIFTQRLQKHNRAIVIGEETPGAAHRTMTYLMNDIFILYWPYERSEHEKDKSDLEGVGIKPDYQVHYNDAKEFAISFVKGDKTKVTGVNRNSKHLEMLNELDAALNSKTNSLLRKFVSIHVIKEHQKQVLSTLKKYNTVWNYQFDQEIVDVHTLLNNDLKVFFINNSGLLQMKIKLNIDNKIENIIYRL